MKTRQEKFSSLSESTKESLINTAKRRGWKYDVKELNNGKAFDVTLHVPKDYNPNA